MGVGGGGWGWRSGEDSVISERGETEDGILPRHHVPLEGSPTTCPVLRMETHHLLQPDALNSTKTSDQYNQLSEPWGGIRDVGDL